jgi:hypothetical protein
MPKPYARIGEIKMKLRSIAYIATAGAILSCLGVTSRAQSDTVKFSGSYSTTWDGDDAGIYGGTVNGSTSPGFVSDDFTGQIHSGESWQGNAIDVSQLTATDPSTGKPYLDNTLFGSKIGVAGYAEMAMLVSMMFNGSTSFNVITGLTQSELSSAIWAIGSGNLEGLDAKTLLLIVDLGVYFSTHSATAYLDSMSNLWILTSSSGEVWTEGLSVPEGGAALLYLLIAGVSCFGGLLMQRRRLAAVSGRLS